MPTQAWEGGGEWTSHVRVKDIDILFIHSFSLSSVNMPLSPSMDVSCGFYFNLIGDDSSFKSPTPSIDFDN